MPDLFSMTAPLLLRSSNGEKTLIAEIFPHPEGALYMDLYWREFPSNQVIHVLNGELSGEGPWKIGEHVISVLSCSDPALGMAWQDWNTHIELNPQLYGDPTEVVEMARGWGASV